MERASATIAKRSEPGIGLPPKISAVDVFCRGWSVPVGHPRFCFCTMIQFNGPQRPRRNSDVGPEHECAVLTDDLDLYLASA